MRASEIVAAVYAAYLALTAALPRWPQRVRLIVWAWAAGLAALLAAVRWSPQTPSTAAVRDWAPMVYLFVGYYATGVLFIMPSPRFEAWLSRCDARLIGTWRGESLGSLTRGVIEGCYAATFLVIPAGFAVLVAGGFRAMADRYWTTVLLAELGAFAPLPWLPSRPPWALEALPQDVDWIRRFGLSWVRRTSHCANTFPSGHTAGSLAVALAVLPVLPVPGLVLLSIALGIASGCICGRYHYAIDVVTGAALALVVWALVAATRL